MPSSEEAAGPTTSTGTTSPGPVQTTMDLRSAVSTSAVCHEAGPQPTMSRCNPP